MSDRPTSREQVQWRPLGELVTDLSDGLRIRSQDADDLSLVRLSDLRALDISLAGTAGATHEGSSKVLAEGDVVLAKTGDEPRAAVVPATCAGASFAADVYRLQLPASCPASPEWVSCYLNSATGTAAFRDRLTGDRIRRIRPDDLQGLPIPLPPDALQRRVERLVAEAAQLNEDAAGEFAAVRAALDGEVSRRCKETPPGNGRFFTASRTGLDDRWDVSYQRMRLFADGLADNPMFRRLGDLARFPSTSRKSVRPDANVRYVQTADIDPRYLTFSKPRVCLGRELPTRVRVPLSPCQVLVLVSSHSIGTDAQPVAVVEPELEGCMASNAFIAMEFDDTPLYFGLVLKHGIVLRQLRGLASGGTIPFLTRGALEQVLVPVLGEIWRHDFNDRAMIAWEKRRRALDAGDRAIRLVEEFLTT